MKSKARPALIEAMTADTPEVEPRYERYRLVYPSGTAIGAYYFSGATVNEVRVTHPMAVVEAVEDSLVGGVPGA